MKRKRVSDNTEDRTTPGKKRQNIDLLKKSKTLFNNKQYTQASCFLDKFSQMCESNQFLKIDHEYFGLRGMCSFYLSDYKSAISYFTKAIEKYANNPEYYNYRGLSYFRIVKKDGINKSTYSQFVNAVDDYSKAIKLDPNNPEYFNNRRKFYYFVRCFHFDNLHPLERANRASIEFSSAILLDPDNSEYYYNRGKCYTFEKTNLRIEYFTKAIQLNPHNSDYYLDRGIIFKL